MREEPEIMQKPGGAVPLWRRMIVPHRMLTVPKTSLLVASGAYLAQPVLSPSPLLPVMALASLLWMLLYVLNEATDLSLENGHQVSRRMLAGVLLAPLAVCLMGILVSTAFLVPFLAMWAGQVAYCVPPLRVKRFWWGPLLLSGVINPVLRVQCGALCGLRPVPGLVYLVVIAFHLSGAARTRLLQRGRDQGLGYRVGSERIVRFVGLASTLMVLVAACVLTVQRVLPAHLAPFLVGGALAAVLMWSSPQQTIGDARRGWLPFALVALIATVLLVRASQPAPSLREDGLGPRGAVGAAIQ